MIPLEPSLPQTEHAFSVSLVCLELQSLNNLTLCGTLSVHVTHPGELSLDSVLQVQGNWSLSGHYAAFCISPPFMHFTSQLFSHFSTHITDSSLPHTLSVCLWECYWLKWRRYIQLLLEKLCSSLKQNTETPISKCFCGVKIFSFQFWF